MTFFFGTAVGTLLVSLVEPKDGLLWFFRRQPRFSPPFMSVSRAIHDRRTPIGVVGSSLLAFPEIAGRSRQKKHLAHF